MDGEITSRRLELGVAFELMPLGMLALSALLRLTFVRVDLIYNASMAALVLFLVSGVGWIVVGHPIAALTAFMSRVLVIAIGWGIVALHDNNCQGAECYSNHAFLWIVTLCLLGEVTLPAISALLLWRVRSVEHDDFSDGNTGGAPDPSAKSA